MLDTTIHKTQDEDKQNKKTQHNICWTPPYTRWRQKKNNQRTKLSINILDTIESESTTRFKNRSSDRMITSDWLVDVSDDRYTTNKYCVFFSNTKRTFDTESIHIFGLVYYLSTSRNSPFYIRCYTYGKRSFVLF
jgi:hypothetical protein